MSISTLYTIRWLIEMVHRSVFFNNKKRKRKPVFLCECNTIKKHLALSQSMHKINKFMFTLRARLPHFSTLNAQTIYRLYGKNVKEEEKCFPESSVERMDKRKCIFAWFPTMRLPFSDYFSFIVQYITKPNHFNVVVVVVVLFFFIFLYLVITSFHLCAHFRFRFPFRSDNFGDEFLFVFANQCSPRLQGWHW